ncbi:hypothetical protein [Mycolicibacter arupensis]|uniref:DUF3800 domain-containing protein n=1 Tax=Mycolicibacter arupensis TaxID=342002 RepID=A0A5C7XQS4_9MYCO|nr:hypothetical protein [Mycolicibacter arupensis]TXI51859.1 MAG: hypothetical protein E6Q54_19595 [Mycolicibacter arupensis]
MTTRHIYVDETKERGYIMAASFHTSAQAHSMRRELRTKYVLPGQTRIHMAKEGDSRRRQIADAICRSGATAAVYDAGRRYADPLEARERCLKNMIANLPAQQTALCFEQDDSILRWDKSGVSWLV